MTRDPERDAHPFLAHPLTLGVAGVIGGLILVATATLLVAAIVGWHL